ncbi:hypothetical protein G6F57_007799 [Rhizopus arrhizus]|uniref:ENTH domain-containing protein n=1 Tax=Rhizopus oryzae TaxID=64495 RepID=A0A9P6X775_RHIOR|nr:hypothetical protein G6F30_005602 [Rhizopus arrhizus]KAG1420057.1 hypothetical protein G6F58_004341 [Rhizopus delemar]KAG0984423.1 hypothetical protein G6F29_004787 [Rhizopus arrhizus]KAG0998370.1 hypothetical protein G6F28_002010 [Rhizopus arrhizus]KAG1011700.1 hypothetical protein G6F27_003509 [Rhizopus arrhizus]
MNSLSNFQIPDVWEVKDVINKVKNVMLNYTEMEAKVHEATNNERWGASTTLLQEIAQGTHNYQYFNEIMPTIYKRFTEKEPKQWRQIYKKALVLLEYLIKNGSERVVDDARAHASMIKIMRNFYYIDETGKDEGLNVRNRAKEIVELLADTERIRTERQLAKKNRNKYVGVGSESMSLGSRYMGFGSDSNHGISFNGDALNFNELRPYSPQGKYDEEDDFDTFSSSANNNTRKESKEDVNKDDDDDWGEFTCGGVVEEGENEQEKAVDDDFADFQFAVANTKTQKNDLFDLLGDDGNNSIQPPMNITSPQTLNNHQTQAKAEPQVQKATPDAPAGMWAQASSFVSLDSLGKATSSTSTTANVSMNSLKTNSAQNDWNNWATSNAKPSSKTTATTAKSSPFDDLLSL